MTAIDVELPVLLLLGGLLGAIAAWLLATYTHTLRGYRYRLALGLLAFPLSGLMGFFSALKLAADALGDRLAAQPETVPAAIGYLGYALFGALGCWTAVRIGGRLDRKDTLAMLYTLLENRRKP